LTTAVLDASAVIALLRGERGGSKVAEVIADAAIGIFNHAEVVSHFVHLGAPLDEVREMLGVLPFTIIAADEALSWEAGALRATTSKAGLSLGDRFCLALARRMDLPAYTADAAWQPIAPDIGVRLVNIRR
jgi:PIN domain nuclease of toxin-antitoxin system